MQQPSVNTGRSKRLVLHFDINNTILMKDPAKGITSVNFNVSLSSSFDPILGQHLLTLTRYSNNVYNLP